MKGILWGTLLLLCISVQVWALFCSECGQNIKDTAKFCPSCGAKQAPAPVTKTVSEIPKPKPGPVTVGKKFRTKTELYIYDKRGDELNVLKKNFLFKPRREKVSRNTYFHVLEEAGNSCLVQTVPETGTKIVKGWVIQKELLERTDWERK
jgi:hypothetical protein